MTVNVLAVQYDIVQFTSTGLKTLWIVFVSLVTTGNLLVALIQCLSHRGIEEETRSYDSIVIKGIPYSAHKQTNISGDEQRQFRENAQSIISW